MSTVHNITDDSFEMEVLKSDKPVLIDFWAEWCGPCKVLGPVIDEIAAEFDNIKFTKLNIDENPKTAPIYGIRGIPTIMIFKNGELAATNVGVLSKSELTNFLNDNLWGKENYLIEIIFSILNKQYLYKYYEFNRT